MTKITKIKAEYKRNIGHCKSCVYFHPNTETCSIVEGTIRPQDGCKYYKRKR